MDEMNTLRRVHRAFVRITTATLLFTVVVAVSVVLQYRHSSFQFGPGLTALCLVLMLCGIFFTWLYSVLLNGYVKRLTQSKEMK